MKRLLPYGLFLLLASIAGGRGFCQSGTAFRDYNNNGTKDASEPGVENITVKSYATGDVLFGTATTLSDGTYTLSPSAGAGQPLRIEFQIPSSTTNFYGAVSSIDYDAPNGAVYGSAVQFVTGTAGNINFAINNPANYTTTGARLATCGYVAGDPLDPGANMKNYNAVSEFSYSLTGGINKFAESQEVGSLWALSYNKRQRKLYGAACLKRHAGLGPLGIDGIYQMNVASPYNPVKFIELYDDYGIDVGTVGVNGSGGRNLPNDKGDPSKDSLAYWQAAEVGIGGMDFSDDEKYLYLVNLFDKKLYRIEMDADNNPATAPSASDITSYTIPDPGCSNSDYQPYGLKFYRGKIYVGVVCTALTSQSTSDLYATVYSFDGSSFTSVLNTPLNYAKGMITNGCSERNWQPWTNTLPVSFCGSSIIRPQPILSDIDFDNDGSLVLGFGDRTGFQVGYQQWLPQYPSNSGFYQGRTGGDILRAYNNNGVFEIENNGKEGPSSSKPTSAGAGNNEGPGGGEFYYTDWQFNDAMSYNHGEITTGSVLIKPGEPNVLTTSYDPLDGDAYFYTGGVLRIDNTTGAKNHGFVVYGNNTGGFGKAINMGDLELIDELPPVEIGNRVWDDTNLNNIQDGGESGIAGVIVELYDNSGTVFLASTTTDGNGNWYFNNSTVPALLPNSSYKVRVSNTQFSNSGIGVLAGFTLVIPNQTGNGIAGYSDSDAFLMGDGSAEISVNTGDYGWSNHNLDIGFVSLVLLGKENISLAAKAKNKTVELNWKVDATNNFSSFIVEYSTDGRSFQEIKQVNAIKNKENYSFIHSAPLLQANYYRIKAVTGANSKVYTPIQIVVLQDKTGVKIYPNPIHSEVVVQLPANLVNHNVELVILNEVGQKMISKSVNKAKDQEKIDVSRLKNGTYYLKVQSSNSEIQINKILILK